ncbi:MAG: 4-hydroxythreonine-4-phosphate dehydrogenase PdxA, partial [Phenylobacterium sp.]|uniref:4-hydroxythreonine-4-phosphate dehydrogenase PdxA n=1 Tax=Phenylobacterium sp. TaxID=1871053 RepID=UPI0027370FB9
WLARRTGTPEEDVFLMLCWGSKRIAHATLHQSVRSALEVLTQDRIHRVLGAVETALRRMGIASPRIGVSGVNPHAGESGLFGAEETEIIEPAVRAARARGLNVVGPIGADTLLPRDDCDAFVVMLHDQGHILAKSAAPHGAAALSIGTSINFSSVGHGTAMDIAGKGQADPEALVQAVLQVTNAASRKGPTS